jgi:hypothetical protein
MTTFKKGDRVIFTCHNGKQIKCEFVLYWDDAKTMSAVKADSGDEFMCRTDILVRDESEANK